MIKTSQIKRKDFQEVFAPLKELSSLSYIDQFLGLKCSSDLLKLKLYPNAKEITESMGCFQQAMNAIGGMKSCARNDFLYVIVGDGSTPRTAALFAYRTRGQVISIDPNMQQRFINGQVKIDRLASRKDVIENIKIETNKNVVIVLPHSHASVNSCMKNITVKPGKSKFIVSMPCCVPSDLSILPSQEFCDHRVYSPENKFQIWKFWGKSIVGESF